MLLAREDFSDNTRGNFSVELSAKETFSVAILKCTITVYSGIVAQAEMNNWFGPLGLDLEQV